MSDKLLISVVMGVYNGASQLDETIKSVLDQDHEDLEFIIVNDGSTDATAELLEKYAANDKRIRVIHKQNEGLTAALIDGCNAARGEYIARQDAGDISLPSRLSKELATLQKQPGSCFVSCGTRFIGPGGELLYDVMQTVQEAVNGFGALSMKTIRGPSHHGSTMFRAKDYFAVGGYRACFKVAQDIDLWTRLVEIGQPTVVPEILYVAEYSQSGISTWKREQQIDTMALILECANARRKGRSEEHLLEEMQANDSKADAKRKKRTVDSDYFYFIGSCLKCHDQETAIYYIKKALRYNPLNIKAIIQLIVLSYRQLS